MSAKYVHKRLSEPQQTTRLLHLSPAASKTDELHGSLVEVDLTQKPPPKYEAVSYAWGDPVFSYRLYLDGRGFYAIAANLSQCLISLRRKDAERVLWVDAVCINQDDLREKELQVALMGRIYKTAKRALIWLGESPDDSDWMSSHAACLVGSESGPADSTGGCAVTYRNGKRMIFWRDTKAPRSNDDHLPKEQVRIHIVEAPLDADAFSFTTESGQPVAVLLGKRSSSPLPPDSLPLDGFELLRRRAAERLGEDLHDLHLQQSLLRDAALFRPVETFLSNEEFERALRYGIDEVYTNPWFSRMWVIQEVCLAPKAVLLHRGREMDWQDFSIAMHLLRAAVTEQGPLIPAPAAFDRACEIVRITGVFKAAGTLTKTVDQHLLFVSRLSQILRGQKCKDDRDRVYALLSLQPQDSPVGGILPDYSKPEVQLFQEFAAALLCRGILDSLCDAGSWERDDLPLMGFVPPTLDTLPTWAPDLRHESRNPRLPWLRHYFRQRLASTSIADAKASRVRVEETTKGFRLDVEVLVIDSIQTAMEAPVFPPRKSFDPQRENSFDAVVKHVNKCKQVYNTCKSPEGYPFGLDKDADADTPFWATMVSFSAYTGTPSAILGMFLSAKGLEDMRTQFQKHCLDENGVFANGRESADIETRRNQMLDRVAGAQMSDRKVDMTNALVMYDVIRDAMQNVRFIATKTVFVGLAPPTLIFDRDIIAMVRGTRIPFILRPINGKASSYTLVGSCYVYGLMDVIVDGDYKTLHLY